MNTQTKSSVRKDALVATLVLTVLGLLWLVFGLYWQGLLLLLAASAVAFLGVRLARGDADAEVDAEAKAEPTGSPTQKRARPDKARRGKKRRRRK